MILNMCVFVIQADKKAVDADKAVTEVEKTHKKAKELDSEIQNMLKKIKGTGKFRFRSSSNYSVVFSTSFKFPKFSVVVCIVQSQPTNIFN